MKKSYILPQGDLAVTPHKGRSLYEHVAPFTAIVIGSGCPETVIGRSSPSSLIQYKGNYFLIDVGEGTLHRFAEGGLRCGDVSNIFFTHHHADHNAGYPYFLINSWMNGRDKLNLVGPPDTKKFHNMILDFYDRDIRYRATRRGVPLEAMIGADIKEIEDTAEFELDGVAIKTAKMLHTEHNIGYRFEADGISIVVSGDTCYTPALIELAKGADILIMDAGGLPNTGFVGSSVPVPEGSEPILPPRKKEENFEAPPHPAQGELAKIAAETDVKTLVITHYMPFAINEELAEKAIRSQGFKGDVVFGRDLMEIAP